MGGKQKRGVKGNVAQYLTRNQALKKLQLRLSEFRRLCIVKGIFPREPKKKVHGQNKTYYHVKDVNFLAHESLLQTFREIHAWDKKIKRAVAKGNKERANKLHEQKPRYRLDHLVKERYPTFVDALRDLDDPLTLVHLFATLPAESAYSIPRASVERARRLALEWQAWLVNTSSLRKVFVSVKGFYFQADVHGQTVTWLTPHALSQVLPADVDYRVMLTFLEFYCTLLGFANYKLYNELGLRYPPVMDARLATAAEDLAAIMSDMGGAGAAPPSAPGGDAPAAEGAEESDDPAAAARVQAQLATLPDKLTEIKAQLTEAAPASVGGGSDSDSEGEQPAIASGSEDGGDGVAAPEWVPQEGAAGGEAPVDPTDAAAVCGSLYRGQVFYLGREVPREALMLCIRAFGGTVGWQGEGSPFDEEDDTITYQIVDRPKQASVREGRQYVQPQWVFDSCNIQALADAAKYAPGVALPPHLSPFVNEEEEGYVPEYGQELKHLQAMADAARRKASGMEVDESQFLEGDGDQAAPAAGPGSEEAAADVAEHRFQSELGKELAAATGGEAGSPGPEEPRKRTRAVVEEDVNEDSMKSIMMSRKTRKLYGAMQRGNRAKEERVDTLKRKAAEAGKKKQKAAKK